MQRTTNTEDGKTTCWLGFASTWLQICSMVYFTWSTLTDSNECLTDSGWFYGFFCFFRFIQAIASAYITVSSQAMITMLYPEQATDAYVGLGTLASAFGYIFGPFFGYFVFTYWGWSGVFTGGSLVHGIWALVIVIFLPNSLNKTDVRDLRTRFESRYSFASIIIEGSEVNGSSIRSNSVADLFNSMNNQQIEPNFRMLLEYKDSISSFVGLTILMMVYNL